MNTQYNKRLAKVCDYIQHNLDETLNPATLCELAAFSRFHFDRLFQAHFGMSVSQYIQRTRLKRASLRLAFETDKRVLDIALEARFESPEAFARAFKRTIGLTPTAFRIQPAWPQWHAAFDIPIIPQGAPNMPVRIIQFPDTPIAFARHKGCPQKVFETAAQFITWRKNTGLSPIATSKTFGIPYSDPKTTPTEDFVWDVGGSITGDVPVNNYGVEKGHIPGGRCAVIRHEGSHSTLERSVYYLYRDWLSTTNESLRDYPCFFQYLNFAHEVDECDLLTEVYLPLK